MYLERSHRFLSTVSAYGGSEQKINIAVIMPKLGPLPSKSYSKARALGDGSFGAVSVAYNDESGQEVAVKTFDPGEDEAMTTETLREISALRLLNGVPGIVPLLDIAFELSGMSEISAVLPLYNWTLAAAIEDTSSIFKGAPVLRMAVGVLRAISYMHSCEPPLVHRDLKPENVMLDDNMDPVIIDFSFCKFLEEEPPPQVLKRKARKEHRRGGKKEKDTKTEPKNTGNLGTPTYIAPELLEARPYDARADVWSTGVIFLEAFQKERLDTDRDKAALRIIAEKRAQLSNKPVPAALREMLDPDFTKRSTSAEALVSFTAAAEAAGVVLPSWVFPEPIKLGTTKIKPLPYVQKLCTTLGFRSNHTATAATEYLNLVGRMEAARHDVPLFATLIAGKIYERECLDVFDAEDEIDQDINVDNFLEFEENLFRLSGCQLFTQPPS